MVRFGVVAGCVALVVLLAAGCGNSDSGKESDKTLRLGSVFSVTGIGAPFGPQQLRGARLAARHVNEAGGIDGARLEILQRNDDSDESKTPQVMRKLIQQDKVLALLGPTFSNTAAKGDPVANQLGTPVLAVSNTGPGIVGDCPYPCELIFRDSLGEEAAIPANIASLLGKQKVSTAVVAYPKEDPFGESSAQIAAKAFAEDGVAVAAKVEFADPSQLRTLPGSPDALMITASSGEAAVEAIKAAREGGFSGPILGGNAFNSRIAAEKAGSVGKGAQSAAAWYADNPSQENADFIHAYKAAYDEDPDQFAAQAYTGVLLLAQAAEEAGLSSGDLAAERKALAKVELETPLGPFRFTSDHDVSQPIWIVAMNGDGGYDLVEKVAPNGP